MDINNRQCLVVGGGKVAARKVHLLYRAGANVTVISPELTSDLNAMVQTNEIVAITEQYSGVSMSDYAVVIAATDSADANKQVSEDAKKQGVPVNVVDQPELCSFIMPSIIDRSPVQIAVSTGGASPVLARLLRAKLETVIPSAYGRLAELIELYRNKVKQKFSTVDDRKKFWEEVLEGPIAESLIAGKDKDARDALDKAVSEAKAPDQQGEVYLVGAGPGDPDLLTFRALRLMQQADAVVYDRLVSKEILELVRRDADFVYAGKERNNHAIPQENINQLLVRLAKEGKRVLRLKGGDPFIFGRGGEEIETLVNDQIRVNHSVETNIMAQDEAVASGAMALFGEKYGDKVRVLRMGDFSVELCGGTHVTHTGDIGVFKILSESGIAAGVRRIEAVAGQKALNYINQGEATLSHIAGLLKGTRDDVDKKVESILDNNRKLEKEVERLKNKLASSAGTDIAGQAIEINGVKVLATKLENMDVKGLRTTLDQVKNKLGSAAVILATVHGDKISLVAGVTEDKTSVIKAGDLVKMVAEQVGGKGGGRADMAQAGGNDPSKLDSALESVPKWIESILK